MTRRSFLKGLGITAAGGTVLTSGLLTDAADVGASKLVGPGAVSILLNVNGIARRASVEPRMTLADVLRDEAPLPLDATRAARARAF